MKQISVFLSLAVTLSPVHAFWRMTCTKIQTGRLDSIVSPGSVASHVHTVSGPINFNISSSFDSLSQAFCTSCQIQDDKSAYWTPQLYYRSARGTFTLVQNDGTVVYYLGRGENVDKTVPFPPGFRMLSGDPYARSYDPTKRTYSVGDDPGRPISDRVSFNCILKDYYPLPETPNINRTDCGNGLRAQLHFPSCWDGVNLYKPDQSHVAYLSQIDNGFCPPTHPQRIPHLFYEIYYQVDAFNTSDGGQFVFAQGDPTGYGFHGDFQNGWNTDVLRQGIEQCLVGNQDGVVAQCAPLAASLDQSTATTCPQQPSYFDEDVDGPLTELPGCNPVTPGPDRAVPVACSKVPRIVPAGPSLDGLSRSHPVAGVTTLNTPAGPITYNGCYNELDNGRAMIDASYVDVSNLTVEGCATFCAQQGYTLFGVEWAQECYCGTSISTPKASQSECDMICRGNITQYCGGARRLDVWQLAPGSSTTTVSTKTSASTTTTVSTTTSISTTTSVSTTLSSQTSASKSTPIIIPTNLPTTTILTSSSQPSTRTSAASSSTASAPADTAYLGCYQDGPMSRSIVGKYASGDAMTYDSCAKLAIDGNFKYFGLEYARECFVGNTLTTSQIDESKCNMPCTGAMRTMCGGNNALSAFQNKRYVAPVNVAGMLFNYQGCQAEAYNARALPASAYYNDLMTIETCLGYCLSRNYQYAALEYRRECYCNNEGPVNGGGPAPDGEIGCNMACGGNSQQICGGPNRLSLFKLQKSLRISKREIRDS